MSFHLFSYTGLTLGLAYLDPGSGSFIIQLLAAGFLGGLFLVKTYWQKIVAIFRKPQPPEETGEENPPGGPTDVL